jgi:hypothetical protein
MSVMTKLALFTFYAGVLGTVVGGCLASVSAPDTSAGLKMTLRLSAALLLVGAVLCWRSGWKRYREESPKKRMDRFVAYVWFAPVSLLFSLD